MSVHSEHLQHIFTICNKSLVSPAYVCEVSAQNTPQIIYYIILKMPILSGSRNILIYVSVSLNANELLLVSAPFPE